MKNFNFALIPVLTGSATLQDVKSLTEETRRPFLRRLAQELGKDNDLYGRKNADSNKEYILKVAETDLRKVIETASSLAVRRNKNLQGLNNLVAELKKRVLQKLEELLTADYEMWEAIDLAFETAEDEIEEEVTKEI